VVSWFRARLLGINHAMVFVAMACACVVFAGARVGVFVRVQC
jgi:hypothetical protein